ncbi:type II toxin-antitoxin system HicA family toxin [Sulfobacillus thermosulfidooxidans]|uniref:type II toxin-antitoxin system HicA family toxin n=1 Tax=Sulfobacillus thermosulfidooxidans TaxID=28034 RepID=UPI00041303FF|nr:type II toxin-antitoxin system HicA family toxin [Sulfobacillus thermosulfidooxidans]
MPPLPRITARELLQKLERLGFVRVRQTGSHLLIRHRDNPQRYAVIPLHSQRIIPPGTLKHILDSKQVSIDDINNN